MAKVYIVIEHLNSRFCAVVLRDVSKMVVVHIFRLCKYIYIPWLRTKDAF